MVSEFEGPTSRRSRCPEAVWPSRSPSRIRLSASDGSRVEDNEGVSGSSSQDFTTAPMKSGMCGPSAFAASRSARSPPPDHQGAAPCGLPHGCSG